jgi:hypothetical protein
MIEISKKVRGTSAQTYRICGVDIRSDWMIPYCDRQAVDNVLVDLVQCSAEELKEAATEAGTLPQVPAWYRITHLRDGSTFLQFPQMVDFLISGDGHSVLAHRLVDTFADGFYTYLLGHAFSYCLLQLGIEQLHATCVTVGGSAIAFIGDTGFGKSTLAGAFLVAGHQLVTDDMLVLTESAREFFVRPAVPRIKLYREPAEYFWGKDVKGEPMNPYTSKIVIPLQAGQFHNKDVRLAALYLLSATRESALKEQLSVKRLSKSDAFLEICKATFNPYVPNSARSERQFGFASELAAALPVSRLSFGHGLNLLDRVRHAILADLG